MFSTDSYSWETLRKRKMKCSLTLCIKLLFTYISSQILLHSLIQGNSLRQGWVLLMIPMYLWNNDKHNKSHAVCRLKVLCNTNNCIVIICNICLVHHSRTEFLGYIFRKYDSLTLLIASFLHDTPYQYVLIKVCQCCWRWSCFVCTMSFDFEHFSCAHGHSKVSDLICIDFQSVRWSWRQRKRLITFNASVHSINYRIDMDNKLAISGELLFYSTAAPTPADPRFISSLECDQVVRHQQRRWPQHRWQDCVKGR